MHVGAVAACPEPVEAACTVSCAWVVGVPSVVGAVASSGEQSLSLRRGCLSYGWPRATAEATQLAHAGALSWGPGFTSQDLPFCPFVPASKSVPAFCGQGLEVARELVCFHGNWPLVGPEMGQGFGS